MARGTAPTSEQRAATAKREKTRERVLRSAIECIREEGLVDASASRIAQRCGLSWGVIQYHFGDRSGLLVALLERGFDALKSALSDLDNTSSDPFDRLRALVEGTWSLMEHPVRRVQLDIQLALGRDAGHRALVSERMGEIRKQLRELWRKALPECETERVDRAERLATLTLQGLAVEHAVVGKRSAHRADRETLLSALAAVLGLDQTREDER
jgi:AcrR family transcriptional regulator